MNKFAILAAIAAVSAIAAPASAARRDAPTVVRVSLKDKSAQQIQADIKVAAETVCKAANTSGSRADFRACVGGTVRSAKAQLQAMTVSAKTEA